MQDNSFIKAFGFKTLLLLPELYYFYPILISVHARLRIKIPGYQ